MRILNESQYRVSANPLTDRAIKRALSMRGKLALRLRTSLTRERFLNSGTVSIIVPFCNVELYLRAALESIRLQRYQDLQVILVDDGSTDNSVKIAAEFVRRDNRFFLISSNGVGPGGARNVGLGHARGAFISFVDGDDILPFGAIYRQIVSLQDTSVSFCVGAFEHLEDRRRWRSPWVIREHAELRSQVKLAEVPGITRNVFPWNKLFRREFFDHYIGEFPTGTIYEDQVPTALAYTSGQAFAVLPETVYHWRRRASQDSITQQRSTLEHLEARVAVLHEVHALYSTADNGTHREWLQKSLFEDMRPFFDAAQVASLEYHTVLRETCFWLWNLLTESEQRQAEEIDKARIGALLSGNLDLLYELNAS